MVSLKDRLLGDDDEDPPEFTHSKRPSVSYLLQSQEQITEDTLEAIDEAVEQDRSK